MGCYLCSQGLARRDGIGAAHQRADDGWCESNAKYLLVWVAFSVDLHLNLTVGEGGYIRFQERNGAFTVHGCCALYCEVDVQVDFKKVEMEIVKLCRLYTRVGIVNISEPPARGSRKC